MTVNLQSPLFMDTDEDHNSVKMKKEFRLVDLKEVAVSPDFGVFTKSECEWAVALNISGLGLL